MEKRRIQGVVAAALQSISTCTAAASGRASSSAGSVSGLAGQASGAASTARETQRPGQGQRAQQHWKRGQCPSSKTWGDAWKQGHPQEPPSSSKLLSIQAPRLARRSSATALCISQSLPESPTHRQLRTWLWISLQDRTSASPEHIQVQPSFPIGKLRMQPSPYSSRWPGWPPPFFNDACPPPASRLRPTSSWGQRQDQRSCSLFPQLLVLGV